MQEEMTQRDLSERISLIEAMITEGRRTTESWGWVFVLWGAAYYVAILWAALSHNPAAWPVTMVSACALTAVIVFFKRGSHRRRTTIGRAIGAVWIAVGISMFLVFLSLGTSGRIDQHIMVAVLSAMLGSANAASSIILKWKMQLACAIVWWTSAVYACFGKSQQITIVFLTAIFVCQIVFGIYGIVREGRQKAERGAAHA